MSSHAAGLPATVTAAYIDAIGPASRIHVGKLPMPAIGRGEVLIRAQAIAVNHVDTSGGGAGGVGSAVAQLASAAGARVLATARPGDAQWCRANGADEIFDYQAPDLTERIRAAAPEGVDVYWDTSGHHDLESAVPLLARRGRMIMMAALTAHPPLPVGALYTRDASLRGFAISNASARELAGTAVALNFLLVRGILRAREIQTLPLSQAA